jgi:hypothetical protein
MKIVAFWLLSTFGLLAQTVILPLSQVRAGQKGVGKTVFQGTTISDFGAEILGVLPNLGPKQSIILARLTGPEVSQTGVMQGMSGSPVYVDGKLIGAVALAFSFSKEAIAGIRPIEDMRLPVSEEKFSRIQAKLPVAAFGDQQLTPIATPLSFSGFTPSTLAKFATSLRELGLEPRQAVSSGAATSNQVQKGTLLPGAMISVQLMTGDLSVAADGTVTDVEGDRILAFGHEFMQLGATNLPFARAAVIALLPSVSNSFKISAAQEMLGTITADHSAGIRGRLGQQPKLIPLKISVSGPGGTENYQMNMVQDSVLTPYLLNMAVFSTLEARQRSMGNNAITARGRVKFAGLPDLVLSASAAGEMAIHTQVAQSVTFPLQALLQAGFSQLEPTAIELEMSTTNSKTNLQLDQIYSDRKVVRPGDEVRVTAVMVGDQGQEIRESTTMMIPKSIRPGNVTLSVSDASGSTFSNIMKLIAYPPATAAAMIEQLNGFSKSHRLYLKLLRADQPGVTMRGEEMQQPPVSVAQILRKETPAQSALNALTAFRPGVIWEQEWQWADRPVSGNRSLQWEVRSEQ